MYIVTSWPLVSKHDQTISYCSLSDSMAACIVGFISRRLMGFKSVTTHSLCSYVLNAMPVGQAS